VGREWGKSRRNKGGRRRRGRRKRKGRGIESGRKIMKQGKNRRPQVGDSYLLGFLLSKHGGYLVFQGRQLRQRDRSSWRW
jgi:hypothetical protein